MLKSTSVYNGEQDRAQIEIVKKHIALGFNGQASEELICALNVVVQLANNAVNICEALTSEPTVNQGPITPLPMLQENHIASKESDFLKRKQNAYY